MPITGCWDDEGQTIYLITFSGNWTWNEFDQAIQDCYATIAVLPYPVDIIADTRTTELPSGGGAITHANALLRARPANYGIAVVIASTFVRVMVDTLKQMNPENRDRLFTTQTLDEARAIVRQQRQR